MPCQCREDEKGLTLVEMLVAIFVIGIVLMAMASVAFASMRSVQSTERIAVATHLGNELLEQYIALPFDDLGLYADAADDEFPSSSFEGAPLVLFPAPVSPDPRVPSPRATIERHGTTYSARTAITWVNDPETASAQDYKRMVVDLTWSVQGSEHHARVEALRSPGPGDQPLSVTVTPDVVALDHAGVQTAPVTVTVYALEPQTTVNLKWPNRNGTVDPASGTTMQAHDGGRRWTYTVVGGSFKNGATLFTVEGTQAGTTQREVTTIGRALFLHPLDVGAPTFDPPVVRYEPEVEYCSDAVRVTTFVRGGMFSDPVDVELRTWPSEATGGVGLEAVPMIAVDEPAVDGHDFYVDVPLGVLQEVTEVPVRVTVTRPVADGQMLHYVTAIPLAPTPLVEDENGVEVHAPCQDQP